MTYVVEITVGPLWQQMGAPMTSRTAACDLMANLAKVSGEQVYGPAGTSRLRVREVTR